VAAMSNVVSFNKAKHIRGQQKLFSKPEAGTNIYVSGEELSPKEWKDYRALEARKFLADMSDAEVLEVLSVYHPSLVQSHQPLLNNRLMHPSVRDRYNYSLSYETSPLGETLNAAPNIIKVLLVASPIIVTAVVAALVLGGVL